MSALQRELWALELQAWRRRLGEQAPGRVRSALESAIDRLGLLMERLARRPGLRRRAAVEKQLALLRGLDEQVRLARRG